MSYPSWALQEKTLAEVSQAHRGQETQPRAELRGCDRDRVAHKTENIYLRGPYGPSLQIPRTDSTFIFKIRKLSLSKGKCFAKSHAMT